MVKDPICGMDVDENDAEFMTHVDHGVTFYFCSKACQESFEVTEGIRSKESGKKWWQKILKESKGEPPKCH